LGIEVDVDDLVPPFVGMFGYRLAHDVAGIVDENIDPRMFCFTLLMKEYKESRLLKSPGKDRIFFPAFHRFLHFAAGCRHGMADTNDICPCFCQG
jgi:hypothetical protein